MGPLYRPTSPEPGSFWEKTPLNVGYVSAGALEPDVLIGKVMRRGRNFQWTLWDKPVKANTKAKTEPKGAANGLSRMVSNAIWCVRTRHTHAKKD